MSTMSRPSDDLPELDPFLLEIELNLYRIVRSSTSPQMHEAILRTSGVDQERSAYPLLASIDMLYPIRITDLATVLGVTQSTVSRQLSALTDAGLIGRSGDPEDRRASIVRLTRKGERVLEAIRTARHQMLEALLEEWSQKDRRALSRYLSRLADDLTDFHETLEP